MNNQQFTQIYIIKPIKMLKKSFRYYFAGKKIYDRQNSRQIISKTTQRMAMVAGITLGPKGRNILIQNQIRQQPRITKDGVTVVKHLQFQNPFENAVASLIKKSVEGTNKFAGDGTTSSTIMICQIVKSAMKKLSIGINTSRQIREGLKIGRQISLDYLQSVKRQINTQEELLNVAMISTNGDIKISKIISEAIFKCGNVNVEKSNTKQTYLQFFSGLKIVRGVPHPQFKNFGDKIIYNYPLVITSRLPLQNTKQIVKVLELAKKTRKQLMIFSETVSQNILSTLIYNRRNKIIQGCAIDLPNYGQVGSKYLEQISKSTGSLIFDRYTKPIEQINFQDMGKAIKITVDEFQTQIRGQSTLKSMSAVVYAGGNTQTVAGQQHDKIIDALNSVQTAKKKGVTAGAGLTYWNLAMLLDSYQGEFQVGVKVLAEALRMPRKRLYQTVPPQLRPLYADGWNGLNLKTGKIQNMFQAGIVDSVQVCRNVIIDSISLASQLIEVQIGIVPQKPERGLMTHQEIQSRFNL